MKKWLATLLSLCLFLSCPALAEVTPALAADGAHILALNTDGSLWAWGSNQRGESDPTSPDARVLSPVKLMDGIAAVACGRQFSMALTVGHTLLMWGDNSRGQIPGFDGDCAREAVTVAENVRCIAACEARAACVTDDGQVYVWGDGQEMALFMENARAVAVGADFTLILDSSGDVYSAGDASPVRVLTDCAAVFAAGQIAYALKTDGTPLAWGANGTEGRLGLDAGLWVEGPVALPLSDIVSVAPGLTASAAIARDGSLFIWGSVYSFATHFDDAGFPVGSLVEAELVRYGSTPVRLFENALAAAFGDAFVAVMMPGGAVCTWGSNDQGQIGDDTFTQTAFTPAASDDEDGEVVIVSSEQRIFPTWLHPGA